jgi:hypothetical protein
VESGLQEANGLEGCIRGFCAFRVVIGYTHEEGVVVKKDMLALSLPDHFNAELTQR